VVQFTRGGHLFAICKLQDDNSDRNIDDETENTQHKHSSNHFTTTNTSTSTSSTSADTPFAAGGGIENYYSHKNKKFDAKIPFGRIALLVMVPSMNMPHPISELIVM
jgi:hypothetical protein